MFDPTEPTPKEKGVLREMGKGKTMNEAVKKVYGGSPNAVAVTSNRLRKRRRFLRYLAKQGLTNDLIIKTLVDGMKADRVIVDKFGDEHKQPHYLARIAAADRAMKLRGLTLEEQESDQENTTPLVVRSIKFELKGDHRVSFHKPSGGTGDNIIEGETVENTENYPELE